MLNIDGNDEIPSSGGVDTSLDRPKHQKRNIWNEKKNSLLVEFVKNSKYPTPWRPKHGTNKEIWQEISERIRERPDVFDIPVHWEAAKEQLNKIIERQRLRRSAGDYSTKTDAEVYVDEMIKHIQADDEEKHNVVRRQHERAHRRGSGNGRRLPGDPDDEDDDDYVDSSSKKTRLSNMTSVAPAIFPPLPHLSMPNAGGNFEAFLMEREKARLDFELEKERQRLEREKHREEEAKKRDDMFMKLVQDQLVASQAIMHSAQVLLAEISEKLKGKGSNEK